MSKKRKILMNLLETAEHLGIPPKWLKEAAISGNVPCLWLGKQKILFDPEAVEQAMARLARRTNKQERNKYQNCERRQLCAL